MQNISTPSHNTFVGSPNLSNEPFPNAATANEEISAYSLGAVWQKNILSLAKQDLSSVALVSKKMLAFVRALRQQEASCATLVRLSRWINYLPKSESALQEGSSKSVRERIQEYHESFLKQNPREEVKAGQNFFQPVEDAEKLFIEYWNRVFVPELRKQEPNKLKEYINNLNIEDPELKSQVSLAVFGKFIDFERLLEKEVREGEVIAQIRQYLPGLLREHTSTCEDLSALIGFFKKLNVNDESRVVREMLAHLVTYMDGLTDKTMASHFVSLLAKDKDFAVKYLSSWHQLDFTHVVHSNVAGHLIQFLTQNKIPNGLDELKEAEKKGYEQELIELACAFDKRLCLLSLTPISLLYVMQHSSDVSVIANSLLQVVSVFNGDVGGVVRNARAVFKGLYKKDTGEGVAFFKQLLNQIASNSPDQHMVEFLFHICDTEAHKKLVNRHEGKKFKSGELDQPDKEELRRLLINELVEWAGQHPSIAEKLLLVSYPVIPLDVVQYLMEKITVLPQAACLPLLERALEESGGEVLLQKILGSVENFPFYGKTLSYLADLAEKRHFPSVAQQLKDRVRDNANLLDSSKLDDLLNDPTVEIDLKNPSKLNSWIKALTSHLDVKVMKFLFSDRTARHLGENVHCEGAFSLFQKEMLTHCIKKCVHSDKRAMSHRWGEKSVSKRLKFE